MTNLVLQSTPGIVRYSRAYYLAKFLEQIQNEKGYLNKDDFGVQSFLTFALEPKFKTSNNVVKFKPGIGLYSRKNGRIMSRPEHKELINYGEEDATLFLLGLAIRRFPRLRSLYDLLYIDEAILSWPIKGSSLRVRSAFEKSEVLATLKDGNAYPIDELLLKKIRKNPKRFIEGLPGIHSDDLSVSVIIWNERTRADIANMSGINTPNIREKLFEIRRFENSVQASLRKEIFGALTPLKKNLEEIYSFINVVLPSIEDVMFSAYENEARGTTWVPVFVWRESLRKKGVNDIDSLEEEILNSTIYGETGFIFRENLLIETREGSESSVGLNGYAKHAYIRITRIRR